MTNHDTLKDPVLIAAADEIEAVLKKHDIMGVVFMASTQRVGFICEWSPSWSCIHSEGEHGEGIRIRAMREDFASLEEQKETLENSLHGLGGMLQCGQDVFSSLNGLMMAIRSRVKVEQKIKDPSHVRAKIIDPPEEQEG